MHCEAGDVGQVAALALADGLGLGEALGEGRDAQAVECSTVTFRISICISAFPFAN